MHCGGDGVDKELKRMETGAMLSEKPPDDVGARLVAVRLGRRSSRPSKRRSLAWPKEKKGKKNLQFSPIRSTLPPPVLEYIFCICLSESFSLC